LCPCNAGDGRQRGSARGAAEKRDELAGLPSVTLLAYGINNANHTGWLPAHFFHHAFFECGQKRKKHHQGYAGSNPHEDGRDQMNIPKTVCHRSDLFQPADYSPFR
jgi:hypothetical protein